MDKIEKFKLELTFKKKGHINCTSKVKETRDYIQAIENGYAIVTLNKNENSCIDGNCFDGTRGIEAQDISNKSMFNEYGKKSQTSIQSSADFSKSQESTHDDYKSVPINGFGLALLKKMGVGRSIKISRQSESIVNIHPKGLGLGANFKSVSKNGNLSSNLSVTKGSYIKIFKGSYKNFYGKVKGFDDSNGRLYVDIAIKNKVVLVSESFVQAVTKKKYDEGILFRFCRSKCRRAFNKKKNPRKSKWTLTYRKIAEKELQVDPSFDFEKRQNIPLKYSRKFWNNTVSAIEKINEIKQRRENHFVMKRLRKGTLREIHSEIKDVQKNMSLIQSPAAGLKREVKKIDQEMDVQDYKSEMLLEDKMQEFENSQRTYVQN